MPHTLATSLAPGGATLVQAVAALLRDKVGPQVSNADARRVVIGGAVRVNGRRVLVPGRATAAGDRLDVLIEPERLGRRREESAPITRDRVLFEDAHVIAVDKPSGLPTHATADHARDDLVTAVTRLLASGPPGKVSLGVHQRLDVETSGVILFAKSAAANRGLAALFDARKVQKVYLAVVQGAGRPTLQPGHRWTERGALQMRGSGRHARMEVVQDGGADATTRFLVVAREGDEVVVEARPETGRKHQIRAHLAHAGLPVAGDTRYGWRGPSGRVRLHAWRLALPHPVDGSSLSIEAPVPADVLPGERARGSLSRRPGVK